MPYGSTSHNTNRWEPPEIQHNDILLDGIIFQYWKDRTCQFNI
jgi:hypothetical protein